MKWTPRLMMLAVFVLSIAMVAGSAMAQPGGGRPGGGRGGPGGMMGGGMRGPGGGGVLRLLQAKVVRDEVGIDDETAGKVRDVAQKAMESGREAFREIGDFRNMTEEQRQELREKMQKRGEETEKKVAEIIGKDKFRRLKQIEMQMQGVDAMRRPDIAEGLGLSDEQKEKINGLFDANREKMGEMFRNFREMSDDDRAAAREKMGGLRQDLQKQVMAVPTGEQKEILKKMMGEPFAKMDELRQQMQQQMRGGFGRGGEGGRGGRGGEGGRDGRGGGEGGGRGQRGGGERRQRPT